MNCKSSRIPIHFNSPFQHRSWWLSIPVATGAHPIDCIKTYLDDPVFPADFIKASGGVMEYWHHIKNIKSKLSRMGSEFSWAPGTWTRGSFVFSNWCNPIASSVDAEHGRLEVSHLQHNMSSQTFKANSRQTWQSAHGWTPHSYQGSWIVKIMEKHIERRGHCRVECESESDCKDDYTELYVEFINE